MDDDVVAGVYAGLARVQAEDGLWADSEKTLEEGLGMVCSPTSGATLRLQLADLLLELGRPADARHHLDALDVLGDQLDGGIRAAISLRQGSARTALGEISAAQPYYDRAIELLASVGDARAQASAYLAKQLSIARGAVTVGGEPVDIAGITQDQDRRIDLAYDGMLPHIRAQLLEQQGMVDLAENKLTDAEEAFRHALMLRERHGAPADIEALQLRLAGVLVQRGARERALALYSRLGAVEPIEELAATWVEAGTIPDALSELLRRMRCIATTQGRVGLATVYRGLWEVLDDSEVPTAIADLLAMLGEADSPTPTYSPRKAAARAIEALAPRVSSGSLLNLCEELLSALERPSWWYTRVDVIKAIGAVVTAGCTHISSELQQRCCSRLLALDGGDTDPITGRAVRETVLRMARAMVDPARQSLCAHMMPQLPDPEAATYVLALGEALDPAQVDAVLERILAGINATLQEDSSQSQLHAGAYTPEMLTHLVPSLTTEQIARVVTALQEGVTNPYNWPSTRGRMLYTLGALVERLQATAINALADFALVTIKRGLQFDGRLAGHIADAAHGRLQPGEEATILGGYVWLAARLAPRLRTRTEAGKRRDLLEIVWSGVDRQDATLRGRTAHSIGTLRPLQKQEALEVETSLMVLLFDADSQVRAQALLAIGTLATNGAHYPSERLQRRILRLALTDSSSDVRRALASVVKTVSFAKGLRAVVADTARSLEQDARYTVRVAAR